MNKEITPDLLIDIYKKTLGYELDSVRLNEDGTTTHLHSDKFLDEHPERRDSPEFTRDEELEEVNYLLKLVRSLFGRTSTEKYKHPFLNRHNTIERLRDEYFKYKGLIVAFDFDNTIYDRHKKGYDFTEVIDLLRKCSSIEGFTMVLFTVEFEKEKIEEKKKFCNELGIRVDYVNESPIMSESKKPYYNILLDDRAGLQEAYETLNFVISCEKELKLWKKDQE